MNVCETLAKSEAIYLDASTLPKIDIEDHRPPSNNVVRILVYLSYIPIYCSLIGFGEFVGVACRKEKKEKSIKPAGFLYSCRRMMLDVDNDKLRRVEPVDDKFQFVRLAEDLLSRHSKLGGGDVWHIMAALQLRNEVGAPVTLFSFDKDLVDAASAEALQAVYGYDVDHGTLIEELKRRGKYIG